MTHKDQPPYDEIGVDEDLIVECPACERLYVTDSWHYCTEGHHVGDVPASVLEL